MQCSTPSCPHPVTPPGVKYCENCRRVNRERLKKYSQSGSPSALAYRRRKLKLQKEWRRRKWEERRARHPQTVEGTGKPAP